MFGIAVLAPVFLLDGANRMDLATAYQGPTPDHILGTDSLGRDLLARLLVATRLSLGVATLAQVIAFVVGASLGAATAFLDPRPRQVVARAIDTMIAFPSLIVTIYVVILMGSTFGLLGLAFALAAPNIFSIARIVSTLSMALAGRDYILAGGLVGVGRGRMIVRYILPNIAETLITTFTVGITYLVLALSGLSFLGLGVNPPNFDWGSILTEGVNAFYLNPAAALTPLAFLGASAMAFAFVGEALARAANPLTWAASQPHMKAQRLTESDQSHRAGDDGRGNGAAFSAMSIDSAVLQVKNLHVEFPGKKEAIEVVAGVDFEVGPGEVLGIVGESGSGKTMTALAISGLVGYPGRITGGVMLHGQELRRLSEKALASLLGTELAMVFQDPSSSLNPALSIGRQMTEASRHHRNMGYREAVGQAVSRLKEVNIAAAERLLGRRPYEFSGGMRQRVMIAMGLMNEPTLMILDEPTTALDVTVQAQVMDVLAKIKSRRRMSIVFISHNLALIKQNCDRVLVMYAGRVVEDVPTDRILTDSLHPYTRALLEAVPDVEGPRTSRLRSIPGQPPDPSAPPAGCPFHPRCALAREQCTSERPPLRDVGGNRRVACWVAFDRVGVM
jgi:oligopeptide/dipeptide ABC transporter ATP-binding protein